MNPVEPTKDEVAWESFLEEMSKRCQCDDEICASVLQGGSCELIFIDRDSNEETETRESDDE